MALITQKTDCQHPALQVPTDDDICRFFTDRAEANGSGEYRYAYAAGGMSVRLQEALEMLVRFAGQSPARRDEVAQLIADVTPTTRAE
ncbi:MAG: hypothetical protein QM755_09255 [Luteolibacter sp.]